MGTVNLGSIVRRSLGYLVNSMTVRRRGFSTVCLFFFSLQPGPRAGLSLADHVVVSECWGLALVWFEGALVVFCVFFFFFLLNRRSLPKVSLLVGFDLRLSVERYSLRGELARRSRLQQLKETSLRTELSNKISIYY